MGLVGFPSSMHLFDSVVLELLELPDPEVAELEAEEVEEVAVREEEEAEHHHHHSLQE